MSMQLSINELSNVVPCNPVTLLSHETLLRSPVSPRLLLPLVVDTPPLESLKKNKTGEKIIKKRREHA